MRNVVILLLLVLFVTGLLAQSAKNIPLPPPVYVIMRDSTNSIDVVFLQGKGGSLSMEGKNAQLFNSFFENKPAKKQNLAPAGTIMWQIDGIEYLSGNFYIGDSTGYVVTQKNGKEYVNEISGQGNAFLKSHLK